jgi:hypothetical protein
MAETPEGATLINRCNEDQTYEARLAAGRICFIILRTAPTFDAYDIIA